jgi:hypothetical protein
MVNLDGLGDGSSSCLFLRWCAKRDECYLVMVSLLRYLCIILILKYWNLNRSSSFVVCHFLIHCISSVFFQKIMR